MCGIEEPKELSMWPKYRLQRGEKFEKLRKKGVEENRDRDEENQESVLIGESSIKENVTEFGKCF